MKNLSSAMISAGIALAVAFMVVGQFKEKVVALSGEVQSIGIFKASISDRMARVETKIDLLLDDRGIRYKK